MEFGFFPRSYTIQEATVPTPTGPQPVVRVVIQDVSGAVAAITFGADDWAGFQKVVLDPAAARAASEARSKIVLASWMAPSVKERKH